MKIATVGTGYVGLANALLLAQYNDVVGLDIDAERVDKLNSKLSPIEDLEIQNYLAQKELNFKATLNKHIAYKNASRHVLCITWRMHQDEAMDETDLLDAPECFRKQHVLRMLSNATEL